MKRHDILSLLLQLHLLFLADRAESSRIVGHVAVLPRVWKLRGGASSTTTTTTTTGASWKQPAPRQSGKSSSTTINSQQQRWSPPKQQNDMQQQQQQQMSRTEAKEELDAFLTRDSRNSFITRVYAILSCQLAVTAASVVLFGTQPVLSAWMKRPGLGASVPTLSLLLSTIAWFVMCASPEARRTSPTKYKWLAVFTLGEAISVGFISSFYQFRSVVSALTATALAATGVSLYTANQQNPQYDLSQWGAGLSSCGLVFLVYGVIQLLQMTGVLPANFLPYNDKIYGLVGSCLFSFYLAYHTKLIVAGKHSKYQMNEKDYVYGAMTLYNDIINLFIYTLRLIGEDREER